jgi:hypothetical protein
MTKNVNKLSPQQMLNLFVSLRTQPICVLYSFIHIGVPLFVIYYVFLFVFDVKLEMSRRRQERRQEKHLFFDAHTDVKLNKFYTPLSSYDKYKQAKKSTAPGGVEE